MGNQVIEESVDRRAGGITAAIIGLGVIAVALFLYIAVTLFGWAIGIAMTVLGLVIIELVALLRARGA
jgi:hypothetical protein